MFKIFLGIIVLSNNMLFEFFQIWFAGDEFTSGVEKERGASIVNFTGKWSKSSTNSGSW